MTADIFERLQYKRQCLYYKKKSHDYESTLPFLHFIEELLSICKEQHEALEHYEACHYDLSGRPCAHDKTASEALASTEARLKKLVEG